MGQADPFRRAGWYARGIIAFLAIAVVAYCIPARSAEQDLMLTPESCRTLSEVVEQSADARDAGVGQEAYAAYMRLRMARRDNSPEGVRIVLREIARVYAGTLAAGQLQLDVYTRCMTGAMNGAGA